LVQGFIAGKVLEQGLLSQADKGRGRFRAFLVSALATYVVDQRRYEGRAKRSAAGEVVSLDSAPEPADETSDPRLIFDVEWARRVLGEALEQMRTQCVGAGRRDLWVVFDERVVRASLGQAAPTPYAELVLRHGFESAGQASNRLMTAKRLFQRCLRAVVRGYAADEAEVDEELADLERILSRG
jgi:RNA polymerase sigma-70 factor (ECF subfamily)